MEISFFGDTHRGKVRKKNEDCFLAEELSPGIYLFIVADGMGGHMAGEVASSLACKIIREEVGKNPGENPLPLLLSAFEKANEVVFKEGKKASFTMGMGTTLTVLYLRGNKAFIAHVGDSRVYMLKEGKFLKLTKDHSLVEKLLMNGSISPEEAKNHPKKNILYESVGVLGEVHPQLVGPIHLEGDETFLLCSDGLTFHLSDEEIKEIVQENPPAEAVKKLIRIANERGGKDNITVITVKAQGGKGEESLPQEREGIFDPLSLVFVIVILLALILGSFLVEKKAEKSIVKTPGIETKLR